MTGKGDKNVEQPIRLLVVDDHALFRQGIIRLLADDSDFLVVGQAGNGREGLRLAERERPDVVLLDVHMPESDGVQTARRLKERGDVKVLMLTVSDKDRDLLGALAAGADGYLLKNLEPQQLRQAIRQVASGGGALSPEVTPRVMAAARTAPSTLDLSSREQEVLGELAQGATTDEIAATLHISPNTVKTYVRRILRKLEASNRTEAVARAVTLGLLPPRE